MNPGKPPVRIAPDSPLSDRPIAVLGFGSQGKAWAMNLADAGANIQVGLRAGSSTAKAVAAAGLRSRDTSGGWEPGTIFCFMTPDETHPALLDSLSPLPSASALVFAHGFSVHYGRIKASVGTDLLLVAPKGIGPALRAAYLGETGVAALIGVAQDASGKAWELAHALGAALGCERAGIYKSSFKEETEADLFSEQAILCGGVPALVLAGFNLLVSRGYSPEAAYFECLHELKLITDMLVERGLPGTLDKISNTAKFGAAWAAERIVDDGLLSRLELLLDDVQKGRFAQAMESEIQAGSPRVRALREKWQSAALEQTGKQIRERLARDTSVESPPLSQRRRGGK